MWITYIIGKSVEKFAYCFYSLWGLIPRRSAAVRVSNINKNLVVDPTIDEFPYRTNLVNYVALTRYPAALRRGGSFPFSPV
jgi:hypothetical protein